MSKSEIVVNKWLYYLLWLSVIMHGVDWILGKFL